MVFNKEFLTSAIICFGF